MNNEDIYKMCEELQEYANHEETECSEYWNYLIRISRRMDMMSDDFKAAYIKELDNTLDWVKNNTKWVYIEKEAQIIKYKTKELEWLI